LVQGGEADFILAAQHMAKDRAALSRMGHAGRQKALTCSWDAVIEQTAGVMRDAVGRSLAG
jgi:hypothetical protein